jgi:hypothetical protein
MEVREEKRIDGSVKEGRRKMREYLKIVSCSN